MKGLFLFISIFTNLMFFLMTPSSHSKVVFAFSGYAAIIATVIYVCFIQRKYYITGFILVSLLILAVIVIAYVFVLGLISAALRSIG